MVLTDSFMILFNEINKGATTFIPSIISKALKVGRKIKNFSFSLSIKESSCGTAKCFNIYTERFISSKIIFCVSCEIQFVPTIMFGNNGVTITEKYHSSLKN